jgi:hypothetical protein
MAPRLDAGESRRAGAGMTYRTLAEWNAARNASATRADVTARAAEATHVLVIPDTLEHLDDYPSRAIAQEAIARGARGDLYEVRR